MPEASGEIALDPDEGVRRAIGLVFAVFERRRSVSGVLRYFVDHEIRLPDRVRTGPDKGDVRWNRPNRATLSDMLRHPAYAGAQVYGRRHHDGRLRLPGKPRSRRRFLRVPQRWTVLHQAALPAHIDWTTFERNREQMDRNRTRLVVRRGAKPRCSAALCAVARAVGACSRPPLNGRETRYVWRQIATTFGAPRCLFIGAHCVDAAVSAAMSAAISRSAIEVNL